MKVTIVGAGLAGCEAAFQLAQRNIEVDLYEMRPHTQTGAHKTDMPAEFVCSNSLGAKEPSNASGLLKAEMNLLNCQLLKIAEEVQTPAGNALAIDRVLFSQKVKELIDKNPKINYIQKEIDKIPENEPVIIASGPLTSEKLANNIQEFTGESHLHFFDAIAPIVEKESINFDIAWYQNRYDKGEACYINCPMNKEQYEKFYEFLTSAEKIELKTFEKEHNAQFFESCLPIEVIASRGIDTLRFGPMKPIGLVDERTNEKNYAVVQLRQDDIAKSLYNLVGFQTNLKWGEQKKLLQLIPGLENVNITKYGVMHRNTFINSPNILNPTLQTRKNNNIFFAGQITGTEGYTESIADGLIAGINMARFILGEELLTFPTETMIGALLNYITSSEHKTFQPINSNWGILAPIELDKKTRKNKKLKCEILANRALETMEDFIKTNKI